MQICDLAVESAPEFHHQIQASGCGCNWMLGLTFLSLTYLNVLPDLCLYIFWLLCV